MMKNLKAAAVVAGSLAIAGAAVPASAVSMPGSGLADNGTAVTRSLPSATKNVQRTAEKVKADVQDSGVVKTPVFGGTLPNPVDGKLLGGLPINR
ncbi:hypothetical protein GCM10010378_62890 [Streptomyces viridochromogenes]